MTNTTDKARLRRKNPCAGPTAAILAGVAAAMAQCAPACATPSSPSLSPSRIGAAVATGPVAPSLNPAKPEPDDGYEGASLQAPAATAPLRQPTSVRSPAPVIVMSATRRLRPASPPPFDGSQPADAFLRPPAHSAAFAARPDAWTGGDLPARNIRTSVEIKSGETLVDALGRAGIDRQDVNAAIAAISGSINLRALRPGESFDIAATAPNATLFQSLAQENPQLRLFSLSHRPDTTRKIILTRTEEGYSVREEAIDVERRMAAAAGSIEGSLFLSARRAGAPTGAIVDLANMFAYDIDFQRDIFEGDRYEAVFEALYDENGQLIGAGDVAYGELTWRGGGKSKGYYRFQSSSGGSKADYFDQDGRSAKRLLMKTPIDGARVSSGFGARRHPVLGYRKEHKGVDFAASRGTPIYAAGDGVVERANRYGSYGNYVRIRHGQGYSTAYAHLNGFRKGIRAGLRVEQGDVIGYVGTTGRSTGPHLHYEVLKDGKHVNPQNLKIATGVVLEGRDLAAFKAMRAEIDAVRAAAQARLHAADASDAASSGESARGSPAR